MDFYDYYAYANDVLIARKHLGLDKSTVAAYNSLRALFCNLHTEMEAFL